MIQLCLIVLLMAMSAYFAGSETGIYRLSRLQLRIKAEQGKPRYKRLFAIMKDGQGLILSLILGNNLVNYFITSLVTIMFYNYLQNHHTAEIYATAVVTPVMFLFGEIIPKNIFYYKANTLVPALVWLNWICLRLFTYSGAVPVLKGIFRMLSALLRVDMDTARAIDATQRHQVRQIIHETQEQGLLSESQKNMMSRLIDIPGISVFSVMIKLKSVERVSIDSDRESLLKHLKYHTHTRQLVYKKERNNIVGFIRLYDLLDTDNSFQNLNKRVIRLMEISRNTSVLEAINLMRNHREKIALVVQRYKHRTKPVGIVTITDLIEELTGEINP